LRLATFRTDSVPPRGVGAPTTERCYPVREVRTARGQPVFALRLEEEVRAGLSGRGGEGHGDPAAEEEVARVTEERDVPKKVTAYFARDAK